MSEQAILNTLSEILGDLLGDGSLALTMQTRRADVPGWDSFNYVNFIVAVEMRFKLKFRIAEVESFEDVGAIVRRIRELTGN
jgi:acyl carrier protein